MTLVPQRIILCTSRCAAWIMEYARTAAPTRIILQPDGSFSQGTRSIPPAISYSILTCSIGDGTALNATSSSNHRGGIPVPIKLGTWNWYGRAQRYNTNSPVRFVGITPFTEPQPAVGSDSLAFPQWTNNMASYTTNWHYQLE